MFYRTGAYLNEDLIKEFLRTVYNSLLEFGSCPSLATATLGKSCIGSNQAERDSAPVRAECQAGSSELGGVCPPECLSPGEASGPGTRTSLFGARWRGGGASIASQQPCSPCAKSPQKRILARSWLLCSVACNLKFFGLLQQNNLSNPPTPPASLPPTPPPMACQKMANGFATTEELAGKAGVLVTHEGTMETPLTGCLAACASVRA